MENNLKIQIWSDIMCPFCYIGKRKLEEAIKQFPHKESVVLEWKSFQLDPTFVATPNENITDHLAHKYGKNTDWAKSMLANMTENAKQSGPDFHFEKSIQANSLNAHRLLHLAKKHNRSNEVKELLFKAYLTEGKNVNDWGILQDIGQTAGLNTEEINQLIDSDLYTKQVRQDQQEAQALGVSGVPFFVIDNKYSVSGAQATEVFLQTIEKAWEERDLNKHIEL